MAKFFKYKFLVNETNIGTEENPEIERIFATITRTYSEANEEIAKKEAYNGEYTIEDDGKPEPEVPESPDESSVWDALDAAYQKGVDSV